MAGATRPITRTPTHQAPKSSHDQRLMVEAVVAQSNRWSRTIQMDPRSAARSELNRQKVFQSSGPATYAGALTSSHVTAAAA